MTSGELSVLWQYDIDPNNPDGILSQHTVNSENVIVEDVVLQGYQVKIIHMFLPDLGEGAQPHPLQRSLSQQRTLDISG